ncbi:MAG: MBL fold metallo-hydrolase [Candidatus Pristimantibacillus sp.]
MIRLTVWGGAGEHGRSCYYIEIAGKRILLDCGVKKEQSGVYPLLDRQKVQQLDAVFLSHAHEDHSIALPLLVKMGFTGKVWTTRATVQQLAGYFTSWHKYVRGRGAELPYDNEHIEALRFAYIEEAGAAGQWLQLEPGLEVRWGRSGHLIGSVWLEIQADGKRVFYSGDYSSESGLLIADTPGQQDEAESSEVDAAIIDAAYGMDKETQEMKMDQLTVLVRTMVDQGGKALFPVPAYGRGQDLILWAVEQFPHTPVYIESELMEGMLQMLEWPDWLLPGAVERIVQWVESDRLVVIDSQQERERQISNSGSGIIFTNDGMMQSDKAKWYYSKLKDDPMNGVILTGHLAQGCFGQQLLEEQAGNQGRSLARVARVRYKVHQGLPDVRRMLRIIRSKHTLLVHTGKSDTDSLCEQLVIEGFAGLYSLIPGDTLETK